MELKQYIEHIKKGSHMSGNLEIGKAALLQLFIS